MAVKIRCFLPPSPKDKVDEDMLRVLEELYAEGGSEEVLDPLLRLSMAEVKHTGFRTKSVFNPQWT